MLAVTITNVICFTSLMRVKEVHIFNKYRVNNFETIFKFKMISSDIQANFVSK